MDASQPGFFDHARARNRIDWDTGRLVRDPSTSFEAARSISEERISALQRAIISTLTLARRALTDEEIIERVQRIRGSRDTESSIRTRRAELARRGLVVNVPGQYGITAAGNKCRLWKLPGEERPRHDQGGAAWK